MPVAAAKKLSPEEEKLVITDLAVKMRRGLLHMKDVPEGLRGKVHAVPERDIIRRAIETSRVKRYGRFNKPPASRH